MLVFINYLTCYTCDNFVNDRPFLSAFATVNFVMSVRPSFRPSVRMEQFLSQTGTIFMKFDIRVFLEYVSREFKPRYNRTKITGSVHEHRYTSLIIRVSRLFLLRVKNTGLFKMIVGGLTTCHTQCT